MIQGFLKTIDIEGNYKLFFCGAKTPPSSCAYIPFPAKALQEPIKWANLSERRISITGPASRAGHLGMFSGKW